MRSLEFDPAGIEDSAWWVGQDRKKALRIIRLIQETRTDPMDMQDLDLEIGIPFVQRVNGEGEVINGEMPGGKAAGCLHVGPYDQLRAAYEALMKWMEANGYRQLGVAYESYLNDPHATPPNGLQTDTVFLLLSANAVQSRCVSDVADSAHRSSTARALAATQIGDCCPPTRARKLFDALGLQDAGYEFAAFHRFLDVSRR